jgi:hypothetical protein
MTRVLVATVCLAALVGAAQAAHAQGGRPATPGTAPGAPPGPPVTPVPPEVVAPGPPRGGNANQPLGSSLAQTNGTIRPPAVDPGMQRTPTEGGAMTIIPPPGTPGGAPGAVAK